MYPYARETLRGTQRNTYIDTQKTETHRVKINTNLNKNNKEIKKIVKISISKISKIQLNLFPYKNFSKKDL